jgi:hypothetical protein
MNWRNQGAKWMKEAQTSADFFQPQGMIGQSEFLQCLDQTQAEDAPVLFREIRLPAQV